MGSFIDLRINRDMIEQVLSDNGFTVTSTAIDKAGQKNILVEKNGISFTLEIYMKSGGTTTLVPRNYKDNESFCDNVCLLIADKTKYFGISDINAIIDVNKNHFDEVLENIKKTFQEEFNEPKNIPGGKQYSLSSSKDGRITFKYFDKKGRLQLQGKALKHFYYIFMQLNDKGYDLLPNIDQMKDVVLAEPEALFDEYLPQIKSKLPREARQIASTSLQLLKTNANFSDGFIIVYPMIRTLEHVMRRVLDNISYPYDRVKGFSMFGSNADGTRVFRKVPGKPEVDDRCAELLGKCYTFYYNQRHTFSHMSENMFEIRTIEVEQAKELTHECIELIEEIGNEFY